MRSLWVGSKCRTAIYLSRWKNQNSEKGHMRTQQEGVNCKPRREISLAMNQAGSFILDSSLQNCEKINLCFLSHPICGVILWQPEQTNTAAHRMEIQRGSIWKCESTMISTAAMREWDRIKSSTLYLLSYYSLGRQLWNS